MTRVSLSTISTLLFCSILLIIGLLYIYILIVVAGIIELEFFSKLTFIILNFNCSITNCLFVINLILDILLIAHHRDSISVSILTVYFYDFILG